MFDKKRKQPVDAVFAQMSDTVDVLAEQKQTAKPQQKSRAQRRAEKKEAKARKKAEKALRKKARRLVIPKTAQQTVPYVRVYPESGVIETRNGVFTKAYLLRDVNYTSAKDDEQTEMFLKFAEFLNSFDPTTTFQFLIAQKNMNLAQFEAEAMLPMQDDGLDYLRQEINEEVRTKIRVGRNNLIKNKYLVISREEDSYEEALTSFSRLDNEIVQNIKKIGGAGAEPMTAAQRLELLHDIYNPDSVGMFGNNMRYEDGKLVFDEENFRFDVLKSMGLSTKDMVAPDSFTFQKDHAMTGPQYCRSLYIKNYPQSLRDNFLKSLTDIDCKLLVSITYEPINPEDALRIAKNNIVNINSNLIEKQKAASKAGYSVDLINPELTSAAEEANMLRSDLTEKSQKLFFQTFVITLFADTEEELESLTKSIQSIGRSYLVDIRTLSYQQENGLNTSLPLCANRLEIKRSLISEAAAVFMPMDNQELYDPRGGIWYGINEGSGNLVIANRAHLKNGNGIIIGSSGTGKSVFTKQELEQLRLKYPFASIIVIDPEGEYMPLAKELDGEVIRIAPGSASHLNPLDIEFDPEDNTDVIGQKSELIKGFMNTIMGGDDERSAYALTSAQASMVDDCVTHIYDAYFQTYDPAAGRYNPEAMPTLVDLQDMLADYIPAQGYEAKQLVTALQMYTTGTLNLFAQQTNVEYKKRFVVYDISDLGSSLKPIGMQIVLNNVWNRIVAGRRSGERTWFYVDEFHLLLSNQKSADFLTAIFKRARKYGGVPTVITQNIGDIIGNERADKIFSLAEFMMIFAQKAADCAMLGSLLDVSKSDMDRVKDALPGHGLMIYGGRVIALNAEIDKNSIRYKLMTTKLEEATARDREARERQRRSQKAKTQTARRSRKKPDSADGEPKSDDERGE